MWGATLDLPCSLNSICSLQTPVNTDTFYGPLSVYINGFDCKKKCPSWKGRKNKKKEKNQFNLFQRLILLPSELIKLLALYVITFVLMHIFEKWCLHLGPTKIYVSIFLYLLLSTAIVKNPISLMLFHYLTLQLNWTRWVYNTLWGQSGTCTILLVLILLNVLFSLPLIDLVKVMRQVQKWQR